MKKRYILALILAVVLLTSCSEKNVVNAHYDTAQSLLNVSESIPETTTFLTSEVLETVSLTVSKTDDVSKTSKTTPTEVPANVLTETAEVTTSYVETSTTSESIETVLSETTVTEPPAEIKYEKVGYGDFLKYRKVFKKPEDETNPTGGYPQYINVDGIIYHNRSYIPSRDIDINEHFINDEWFNENIKPCFSDGIVTKEKLFALEIIGEGSGEYDVIPLEDFRTYRIYSTYRYLSDNIIVSNENGKTGFKIWVRHEYFTELCRVARLLWEISMEYEISEITQLTYMFTEKPDALEINVPVEYREQIEAYLEENNVSKDIYIFTEAEE